MNIRRLLLIAIILVVSAVSSQAETPDLFLEELRVGAITPSTAKFTPHGWPDAMFFPLSASAEGDTLDALLWAGEAARDAELTAWRLAPDSTAAVAAAWLEEIRRPRDAAEASKAAFWEAWSENRPADALGHVETVMAFLEASSASPEERLIWALRARAFAESTSDGTLPTESLWPELFALGSYDRRTGWTLWTERRRALGLPLIPEGETSARAARWLCRLSDSGLTLDDVERSNFSRRWKNDLRLSCLEGRARADVLNVLTSPPAGRERADRWADALYRVEGRTNDVVKKLAHHPGLSSGSRTSWWKRLADRHLTAARFEKGRQALDEGVRHALRDGSKTLRALVANECRRGIAMANHRGDRTYAARYEALLSRVDIPTDDRRFPPRHRGPVRAGETPDFGALPVTDLAGAAEAVRARRWPAWIAWGRALAEALPDDPAAAAYGADLAGLGEGDDLDAIGSTLSRHLDRRGHLEWAADWALTLDRERVAGGAVSATASPVPHHLDALEPAPDRDLEQHLLLGLSLLLGDVRGVLSSAVTLPSAGLSEDDHRLFLFPLPRRPELLAILAAHPDPALLLGIARNESLFDPAVRSHAGALGMMQVMPFHFDGHGVRDGEAVWRRPRTSLEHGIAVLQTELERYDGDPYRAVAAYNAGSGAVDRWDRQLGGSPDRATFLAWIGYPSTRRYVEKVLIDRLIYAEILRSFVEEGRTQP